MKDTFQLKFGEMCLSRYFIDKKSAILEFYPKIRAGRPIYDEILLFRFFIKWESH